MAGPLASGPGRTRVVSQWRTPKRDGRAPRIGHDGADGERRKITEVAPFLLAVDDDPAELVVLDAGDRPPPICRALEDPALLTPNWRGLSASGSSAGRAPGSGRSAAATSSASRRR